MPDRLICAGCALLCDDVCAQPSGDHFLLDPACALGAAWLSQRAQPRDGAPDATIAGEPVDPVAALDRAAELLRGARRPLVHGFAGATVEDARAAVALADRLGAIVTTRAPAEPWPGAPAFPLRGSSTATLGEIRDRSQLVIIWREDPETTHPRLLSRLGFGSGDGDSLGSGDALGSGDGDGLRDRARAGAAGGGPSPSGPAGRTLVVVDDRDTATTRRADHVVDWPADRDVEALAELLHRFDGAGHATIIYGRALAAGAGGQRRELALHELVRRLSHERPVVTLSLTADTGNRGADDVLTWQTGYSGTVDLASGHPELLTVTEPLIEHERIDLALCVEDDPGALPRGVTVIALSGDPEAGADVWIRTAPAGVAAAGTLHRLDGVPLTLRPPRRSTESSTPAAPTAATVLADLVKATDI